MASIDTLLDHVMPRTPRLTVDLARLEIRQAAIRFCRESRCDRRTLASFNTVPADPLYVLTAPADTAISEVLGVALDEEKIDPLRPDEIPADAETETGTPSHYGYRPKTGELQLIVAPSVVQAVSVIVAVEPPASTTVLNDWIAQRYGRDIAYGALAELLEMPKKPWSDPQLSVLYRGKFNTAIADARDEADKGMTGAATRTRPVFGLR